MASNHTDVATAGVAITWGDDGRKLAAMTQEMQQLDMFRFWTEASPPHTEAGVLEAAGYNTHRYGMDHAAIQRIANEATEQWDTRAGDAAYKAAKEAEYESARDSARKAMSGNPAATLPTASAARKATPVCTGFLDYFPLAVAEVARLSKAANDQHNPGEPMHWAREKSTDHADCLVRHLIDRGKVDTDGFLHEAKVAWRALALLQVALEVRQ